VNKACKSVRQLVKASSASDRIAAAGTVVPVDIMQPNVIIGSIEILPAARKFLFPAVLIHRLFCWNTVYMP
jgi:hypothetical protein